MKTAEVAVDTWSLLQISGQREI
uniref:Transcription factor bHLH128-like n=1 Tax=Rhizophora mucronata TaxID=61149 RepID=A0A2P2PF46_RHIMU